jgi:hypothetical protein
MRAYRYDVYRTRLCILPYIFCTCTCTYWVQAFSCHWVAYKIRRDSDGRIHSGSMEAAGAGSANLIPRARSNVSNVYQSWVLVPGTTLAHLELVYNSIYS